MSGEAAAQLLRQVFEDPSMFARLRATARFQGPREPFRPTATPLPDPSAAAPLVPTAGAPGTQLVTAPGSATPMSSPFLESQMRHLADSSGASLDFEPGAGTRGESPTSGDIQGQQRGATHFLRQVMPYPGPATWVSALRRTAWSAGHAAAAWGRSVWSAVRASVIIQFCMGVGTCLCAHHGPPQTFPDPDLESEFRTWAQESAFNDLVIGELVALVPVPPKVGGGPAGDANAGHSIEQCNSSQLAD
jgi:hypothetical protein